MLRSTKSDTAPNALTDVVDIMLRITALKKHVDAGHCSRYMASCIYST
ncbi:MAG: hypothetical protein ACFC03_02040 [Candidatus Malihini olakiniferum]